MSADDFQTKYASVMESMLKSAIAETTKLFETMVDELKAEISRIKRENEDLKARCSQFEMARSQSMVYNRDRENVPGRSDGSEKRDTAVQCDLDAFHTMLVEESQPLRCSSSQNQKHHSCEEMVYALQEHDYETRGEGNSQMAFILVKQESVMKQEEVESTVVGGQGLSDKEDSPWTSPCGVESEGPFISTVCSTGEMPLPQRHEETQVALELPFLETHSGLQGAQNQSSELGHSLVISLAAIKDDMEEKSEVSQKISEVGTQGELFTSEKHQFLVAQHQSEVEPLEKDQPSVVPQQCQSESETSINKQTDIILHQYADVQSVQKLLTQPPHLNKGKAGDELKNGVAEVEPSSQSDVVRRRRGRPPKKTKHLQRPVKEILKSPPSDIPTEQEVKNSPAVRVEEVEVFSAVDTVNITSSKSPQAYPVQPKESSSIITPSVQERAGTALKDVENNEVVSLAVSAASEIPMNMGDGAIHASSAAETLKTPLAESQQASSVQSRECHTSVTLQDAMLLVEAMYQSMAENVFSSRPRMAAPPQTKCAPNVGALPTVDEAPAQLQTSLHPVETHEAVDNLSIMEQSTTTQSTIETGSASPQTTDVTPTNEKHELSLSNTTTSTIPPSSQINVQALQQHFPHPLITSVATSRRGKVVPQKIIVVPRSVSSLMPHKIAMQSPNQLPTVTSRVVAAQNVSVPPGSTAAGSSLGTPSISSVPQKTIYVTSSKSLPVVTQSATTSTDPQSRILLHPKITIIPGQVSAVASRKHQSQTIVLMPPLESTKTSAPAVIPSPQLVSSSQEMSVSVDTQTTLDEVDTKSSVKRVHTSDILESPKQTASFSETTNAHAETCCSFNMSVGPVSTSMSPEVPLTVKQKLAPVVRLTRLPFPISTKESVLVSRLSTNRSCGCQAILREDTTQEKLSSVVISTQPSEMLVSCADICPSLKETSVALSVNDSKISEGSNDVQEKALLSTENYTTLEGVPHNLYVQPSAPSKVPKHVFEKSIIAINTTEPSALSGRAGEPTSNLDEEPISIATQNCSGPNNGPVEEKQSASLINLTSITSKEASGHHLQVIKTQFLAQLAASPPAKDLEKASCNDSQDARVSCAETSTSEKKRLQTNSLMAQLRSHIKTHLQARRTKTYPEPHTEKETQTVSPKKPRLENDGLKDKNTTNEHIPLDPKNPGAAEDVTLLQKTFDVSTPISLRKFGLCKDGVEPKRTDSESPSVSCRRSKTTSEFTAVSPRRFTSGRDGIGCKNEKSTSVSPRRSSTRESAIPKKTKNVSMRPRRTSSTRDDPSPKNTNAGGRPNNAKTTFMRPKRTILSRDGVSHKRIISTSLSPKASGKNRTSPKMSTNESPSLIRRMCTSSKNGSNTKQIKRESNSFSPRRGSITTDGADSPKVSGAELAKDGNSPRNTGVSTSIKRPRLIQDGSSPKKNLGVLNANTLSKEAKAKSIAKMKNSNQSKLQNGAKTSQPAANSGKCEAVKKCKAKAVWTPPKMLVSTLPPAGGKRSAHLPIKKETSSPKSKDRPVVYPPSVSLHPIPVKAPPVVSPLQPLSVIGRYLLKNQCGECGRVLSSSAALESHVSLHTGQRPFSCALCGKRFTDSKALKRHGRVHRNGRIHICQQCGKGFVYRFGLTKHLQMVHSRIKPFVCQICNKGCFTKLDVEAHIRIHTGEKPFHCNLCEKKFARRVDLNVHLRWHNGEKRHWCPYCGKGFLDFNNLKRHKYIHTGEKPHACPHCPKHFTQSGHLKKHVKNVHKIQ